MFSRIGYFLKTGKTLMGFIGFDNFLVLKCLKHVTLINFKNVLPYYSAFSKHIGVYKFYTLMHFLKLNTN